MEAGFYAGQFFPVRLLSLLLLLFVCLFVSNTSWQVHLFGTLRHCIGGN